MLPLNQGSNQRFEAMEWSTLPSFVDDRAKLVSAVTRQLCVSGHRAPPACEAPHQASVETRGSDRRGQGRVRHCQLGRVQSRFVATIQHSQFTKHVAGACGSQYNPLTCRVFDEELNLACLNNKERVAGVARLEIACDLEEVSAHR
jgi:hypothetical protein